MIVYKDVLSKLKEAGYNTNRIRKENLLSQTSLQRIRNGQEVTLSTIDKICSLTGCKVEDLIEHVKE